MGGQCIQPPTYELAQKAVGLAMLALKRSVVYDAKGRFSLPRPRYARWQGKLDGLKGEA